jgi:hypothetical protein
MVRSIFSHGSKFSSLAILLTAIFSLGIGPRPSSPTAPLPVFPGAQGFGTETKAGRGGAVLKVTNLNDSGSGSLRAAIDASGSRIIVFEVSGTIILSTDLNIQNPFVTLAGQTAPSPGITLRGASLRINTHDVLVKDLRVRVGDSLEGPDPANRDGITVYSPIIPYNVVIDHVSTSWSIDELIDCSNAMHDVTISNSILSEALNNSIHPKGAHSLASLIGDHAKNVSMVGNLFAHNKSRNPGVKGDTTSVILNNVMYDAGPWAFSYMQDDYNNGPSKTSYVGNVFIEGPSSDTTFGLVVQPQVKIGTELYFFGNLYEGKSSPLKIETSFDPRVYSPPVWHPSLIAHDSSTVEASVLADAGARPADRDSVDKRIIHGVATRTGDIIDSPKEVGGWPNLPENHRTLIIPANPNGDDNGDGYTNIEEVLQQMAAQVEKID